MRERGPGDEREEREEERGDGEAGHFDWEKEAVFLLSLVRRGRGS